MRCLFTFAIAAALAAGLSATSWSQTGGAGGAGGTGGTSGTSGGAATTGTAASNGAGATGTGNNTPGTTGVSGPAGTAGTVGTAGTAGTVGTLGTAGAVGTAGTTGRVGGAGTATRVNGRVNGNAGLRNSAAGVGVNGNFNGVSSMPFFTDPGARQQLNLNDTQFNTLNRAYQNAYTRYNQGLNRLNPNLTEQQRELQLQQLQARFNQDLSGTVNGTFTNPQALSRYNQLNRQYMGFNAFNDPAVRQQLNLTPQQVRQLRTLSNNWRQQLQQFRRGAGNDLSSVDMSQWNQLWQQYATQLNGVLTPDQQQMWTQQTGQPYMFPPQVYFGGRQTGNIGNDNTPVVDPTVPRYELYNGPNTATPRGTQVQPGANQPAAAPASPAPSTASQGGAQGTVR